MLSVERCHRRSVEVLSSSRPRQDSPAAWEDERVERHTLHVSGTRMSLATEARFVSEQQLHDAVAEFPELIPTTDSDWAD